MVDDHEFTITIDFLCWLRGFLKLLFSEIFFRRADASSSSWLSFHRRQLKEIEKLFRIKPCFAFFPNWCPFSIGEDMLSSLDVVEMFFLLAPKGGDASASSENPESC
jgi:hypothetical protein